jgi:hypothetical protein
MRWRRPKLKLPISVSRIREYPQAACDDQIDSEAHGSRQQQVAW